MLWVWAAVFAVAITFDLLTFSLAGAAVAVGAAMTFGASAVGLGPWGSVLAFALSAGLSLALFRPYLVRVLMRSPDPRPLVEQRSPVGARGMARTDLTDTGGEILTHEALPWAAEGMPPWRLGTAPRIEADGDDEAFARTVWSARAFPPGTAIPAGAPVEVLYRDGGSLVVRALDLGARSGPKGAQDSHP